MKLKIELTPEQINFIVSNEINELQTKYAKEKEVLSQNYQRSIDDLDKKLNLEIKAITNKHKYIDYEIGSVKEEDVVQKKRTRIDEDLLKQMVANKKSVKEMAEALNKSEGIIRSKLWKLGIKLKKE